MQRFGEWLSENTNPKSGNNDAALDFVNAVNTMGYANPLNHREIVIDNKAAIEVRAWQGLVLIQSIRSFNPGQGFGSDLMKRLTSLADKLGVTMELDPVPLGDKGPPLEKLIAFYRSFGFQGGEQGMTRPSSKPLKLSNKWKSVDIKPW